MKSIRWRPKALRQIRKIKNQEVKESIFEAVSNLRNFPNCRNIKKLKAREEYRLRVGRWRVIFTESLEILYIEEVRKRDESTY
jgi:mRNA-degrading endonuclease RelE of RelBE toxin-antitoxin system